ncbi:hypothetical protein [Leucobacter massiliensis]|uniref:hypothetical protein n=1 Tax=Leucobacter massiliensis TaxID=1686285 RepID=UPI0011B1E9F9|nr:hypothetical protein [Leucobacter massiliensis]
MRQITNRKFYTYDQEAERVHRHPQTIRKWRMAGMPMTWNQQGERVVAHEILLAEFRRRCEQDNRNQTPEGRAARAEFEADPLAWFESGHDPELVGEATAEPRTVNLLSVSTKSRRASPVVGATPAASAPSRPPSRSRDGSPWARLRAALASSVPECAEDGRFTLDALVPGEAWHLARICSGCPLLDACADYARDANPTGGFWPTSENMAALAAEHNRRLA